MTAEGSGLSERDRLAALLLHSGWWAVSSRRLADEMLAAGFRYVPEPACGYWCDTDVFSGISPLCPVHRGLIPA